MTRPERFPKTTAWTAILKTKTPDSPQRRARPERLAAFSRNPVRDPLGLPWNSTGPSREN